MCKDNFEKIIVIFLLTLTINFCFAQKKEYRDTNVDSLVFVENRKQLNSLNTNNFIKKSRRLNTIPTIPAKYPYLSLTELSCMFSEFLIKILINSFESISFPPFPKLHEHYYNINI